MTVKQIFIVSSYILLAVGASVTGYKIGASTVHESKVIVKESEPVIKTVVKYVNRKDPAEVEKALNAPIDITTKYSDMTGGFIFADISATNGYMRAKKQDRIGLQVQEKRNTVGIGYSVFVADRVIYSVPEVFYLRRFGSYHIGGGIMINAWNERQAYGMKVIGGYVF